MLDVFDRPRPIFGPWFFVLEVRHQMRGHVFVVTLPCWTGEDFGFGEGDIDVINQKSM